jgi:hypothetical protein
LIYIKAASRRAAIHLAGNPEQKRRMGFLTVLVLRKMRSGVEQRRLQADEENDG